MKKKYLKIFYMTTIVLVPITAIYVNLDWKQPLETRPGIVAEFDRHLRDIDSRWQFLFSQDSTVVMANIDGSTEQILLDMLDPPHTPCQPATGTFSHIHLSPDKQKLLIPYLTGDWNKHEHRKLLVLNLINGETLHVPIPKDRYGFDMGAGNQSLCHWVSSNAFILSFTYYPPEGAHLYTNKFMKYTLDNLNNPRIISLKVKRPCFRFPINGFTIQFVGGYDRQQVVYVLDEHGVHKATSDEISAFERHKHHDAPHEVTVKAVSSGEPMWGSNPDWNKYDIHLSDRWVRRSEGLVEKTPIWESELQLYIWNEGFHTYFMDAKGCYRSWYAGKYIGKIPQPSNL